MFSIHGSPAALLTDNGPNYSSKEFEQLIREWEIRHIKTTLHHHKSNGKAESAVKIMKNIIIKANQEGKSMWKAVLEWRNSVTPDSTGSAVERLMSRRTRSFIPCDKALYIPKVQAGVVKDFIRKRKYGKYYHDRNARSLPDLVVGQPTRVKVYPQQPHSKWKQGTEVENVALRSYLVNVEDRTLRNEINRALGHLCAHIG